MCGIFGYIGPRNGTDICIAGLNHLEYRGYDSAGIAGILDGKVVYCKKSGKLDVLKNALKTSPLKLHLAIAHTRWATHGEATDSNAHPHFDETHSLAIVHNGIIENYAELRERLSLDGKTFSTDTDTEVVAQLIGSFYEGDLLDAVQRATALLRGFWGFAVIHKDHPDQIIASAYENPIIIAANRLKKETLISSDVNAFEEKNLEIFFLKNREIACICVDDVRIFDQTAVRIEKVPEHFSSEEQTFSKQGYPHYMLKEIFEQPHAIRRTLHNRCLFESGTATLDDILLDLCSIQKIIILACGTSWHAGLVAAQVLEEKARIPTSVEIASEFCFKTPIVSHDTLVIAISQSGETLDTITAVRKVKKLGVKVIAICNAKESSLVRDAHCTLFLHAGPERSVCSTKAYTTQLTLLYLFALHMARLRLMDKKEGQWFLSQLQALPDLVEEVLGMQEEIRSIAKVYSAYGHFFFIGRQYMYPASLEAALKLKEISYSVAEAYPGGEMKHGPIAMLHPQLAVIALCGNERTQKKLFSNLMEIKARRAPLLAFAPRSLTAVSKIADSVIWLPEVQDAFAPIVYGVASQLFAYYVACELERDIDQPRHLAKSVTVP